MIDGNPRDDGNQTDPMLLTPAQVAAKCNISLRSLWRLRSKNDIPQPVRLGSSVRWSTEVIEMWIKAGCPKPGIDDNQRGRK